LEDVSWIKKIIDLYDDYVHRHFDRRLFLDSLVKVAGSTAAAMALLPLLQSITRWPRLSPRTINASKQAA